MVKIQIANPTDLIRFLYMLALLLSSSTTMNASGNWLKEIKTEGVKCESKWSNEVSKKYIEHQHDSNNKLE